MIQGIKVMRNKEKVLKKLNDLLVTNNELENIYEEALKASEDDSLKIFFEDRKEDRKTYNEQLILEIENLVGDSNFSKTVGKDSYKVSMNFRGLIFLKNHSLIVKEVCRIKQISINKYNALLSELNLPLSVCKLLSEQRDNIQSHMNAIKRLEHLIVKEV
ncbi:DUF2383 domain-containing protein [Flavisericum labens]|uniref:DUF2383 domain-containing protein n=1 Tax=Flavisericum labens TaxID=3377112 RepID=UPI00387B7E5D